MSNETRRRRLEKLIANALWTASINPAPEFTVEEAAQAIYNAMNWTKLRELLNEDRDA